jgi:hypothetical protein
MNVFPSLSYLISRGGAYAGEVGGLKKYFFKKIGTSKRFEKKFNKN